MDGIIAKMNAINKSPLFDAADGWSAGFAVAKGHGPGVVVGPGPTNPNVFAQPFPAGPYQQFEVVARAASVDKPESLALIQISWQDSNGQLISVSQHRFKVSSSEEIVHHTVVAPAGAQTGTLYVAPGGQRDTIRYTEMTLKPLDPLSDFWRYEFFGVNGQNLLVLGTAIGALLGFYVLYRQAFYRARSLFLELTPQVFPILALLSCAAVFVFLEDIYEFNYDSQWHQASIESIMHWNILSVNLGANPLHNFGIQHPVNPQLSPTFWMGSVVSADIRIPVQAAFQAAVLFLIMLQICRNAGARLDDASAISLIAVYYCFVPQLSNGAVMEDALFGLLWQEGAIATLIAFWCFALIGYGKVSKQRTALLFVTLMAAVLWLILAYPELVTFFILATTGLCAGPLLSAQSRRELLYKSAAAVTLIAALLLLRVDAYVLNLFLYTPQMYYANTFTPDFTGYFMTTTSVLNRWLPRGWEGAPLVVFVGLAILGGYFALHFGSSFARRVVFAAISLEAVIFLFGAINMLFKLAPLNLYYAEQMGLTVAALLAGTGAWGLLQLVLDKVLRTWSSPNAIEGDTARPWSLVVLMLLVGSLFYVLSGPNGVVNGWPPATDSIPAQIQSKELAIKPGDNFKGRGVILVAMQKTAPAKWLDAYNVHYYKFRVGLGNDLMNDAEIAGIPIVNEYGHWMSPPMLALLSVAFYRPEDHIDRAAQAPRAFRSNLARAMGVSFALTDSELPQEVEIYRGSALDHPLYMYRIVGANVGDFSPTKMIYASNAAQIVDHLQAPDFDGRKVAIAEEQIAGNLVQAESVVVSLHKGPRLHVEAHSSGTSLLVLPFEFSYCLDVQGTGLDRLIPINLAQIGLIIRGSALLDISYRYGLISGTSCRNEDRRRIDKLRLAEIAPGRLFYSPRAADRN